MQRLVNESLARFDTGCLVFDEGNAVSTETGLQVMLGHDIAVPCTPPLTHFEVAVQNMAYTFDTSNNYWIG